jgi:hypothetical protein
VDLRHCNFSRSLHLNTIYNTTTTMSFQHTLDGLFNKGKAKYEEFTNKHSNNPPPPQQNYQYQPPYQQQPQYQPQYQQPPPVPQRPGGPPPVNYASKPGGYNAGGSFGPPQPKVYWQANFHPSTPIYQLFQQETGAHGWGNNESQNYTKDPANCFFTPDNKLVLRGIVNSRAPEGQKYTSARLVSAQLLSRDRGCLTAVLTAPSASGIWPAFWMLPSDPFVWPTDGEVDIFESWNGDNVNHSCLHWGHFNGEDWNKHRVLETPVPSMASQPHTFSFAWDEPNHGNGGRMVWYIDGTPVMKATVPPGTRPMRDYRIILNVAMGGNVCQGRLPSDGTYDFVVHELKMTEEPIGGWGQFGADWERTREGKTM